jgi:hypothetical protein
LPLTTTEVETLTAEPSKVSVDGQTVESRPADDVIKLDQYAAAKTASSDGRSAWGGVRMAKAKFPSGGPH